MVMQSQVVASAFKSPGLTAYKRSYQKKGQKDIHEQVFGSLSEIVGDHHVPKRVVYPGCHRHITASLCFPNMDYVDCDKKVANVYQDEVVKDWILSETQEQSSTTTTIARPKWTFTCTSYAAMAQNAKFEDESYDLMISLSAGIVSEPCSRYIRPGGHFLVNDSHADASAAFVAKDESSNKTAKLFRLIAVWKDGLWNTADLEDYFQTTKGEYISVEQAREAAEIGSVSKRSFRLLKGAPFYLFRKKAADDGDTAAAAAAAGESKGQSRKRRRVK
ncbi:unnamed protein product [Cylindrotheca closterium]|uniref:Uncharacterized protein n=1 Tax=Cylindrotheca closterium TaxID=2856 RepID=A0AAD2FPF7_9STRA|nr:unnamed protein product [Cylindrotheca closterium]